MKRFIAHVPWQALVSVWLVLLTGHWAADGFRGEHMFVGWWEPLKEWHGSLTILSFFLFVFSSLWAYWNRHAFSVARSLSRYPSEPRSSLILLVSSSNLDLKTGSPLFPFRLTSKGATIELEGRSLTADIQT